MQKPNRRIRSGNQIVPGSFVIFTIFASKYYDSSRIENSLPSAAPIVMIWSQTNTNFHFYSFGLAMTETHWELAFRNLNRKSFASSTTAWDHSDGDDVIIKRRGTLLWFGNKSTENLKNLFLASSASILSSPNRHCRRCLDAYPTMYRQEAIAEVTIRTRVWSVVHAVERRRDNTKCDIWNHTSSLLVFGRFYLVWNAVLFIVYGAMRRWATCPRKNNVCTTKNIWLGPCLPRCVCVSTHDTSRTCSAARCGAHIRSALVRK